MENLPPHVLRLVYKEVSALAADPPEGIKIYPSEEDITELHTAIEGPGKHCNMVSYQTGIGHVKLKNNTLLCVHSQSKKLLHVLRYSFNFFQNLTQQCFSNLRISLDLLLSVHETVFLACYTSKILVKSNY